jgi:hypothetical protein
MWRTIHQHAKPNIGIRKISNQFFIYLLSSIIFILFVCFCVNNFNLLEIYAKTWTNLKSKHVSHWFIAAVTVALFFVEHLSDKVTYMIENSCNVGAPNPTFSDLAARWRTKSYRDANFLFSSKVRITFYVPTQWVFGVKIDDWVRWKGIAMIKNEKLRKPTKTIFHNIFFCSDDLKWNCSKSDFLKIWKNHI